MEQSDIDMLKQFFRRLEANLKAIEKWNGILPGLQAMGQSLLYV